MGAVPSGTGGSDERWLVTSLAGMSVGVVARTIKRVRPQKVIDNMVKPHGRLVVVD